MTPSTSDLERRIDELYALPAEDFTATRNELVKALRKDGDREAADRVKALRKPPATAWAVNQLVHHRREVFDALIEATREIRTAHQRGPDGLNTALATRKDALAAAAQVAEVMLMGAGSRPGPTQMRRVAQNLEALSTEPEETVPGRLAEDLDPPGFAALAGLAFGGVPDSGGERRPGKAGSRGPKRKSSSGKTVTAPGRRSGPSKRSAVKGPKAATKGSTDTGAEGSVDIRPAKAESPRPSRRELASAQKKLADAEEAASEASKELRVAERSFAKAEEGRDTAEKAVDAAKKALTKAEKAVTSANKVLASALSQRVAARKDHRAADRERTAAERRHAKALAAAEAAHERLEALKS